MGFSISYGPDANGRLCPKDLPPKSGVHDYLELWNWDGTLARIHPWLNRSLVTKVACGRGAAWKGKYMHPVEG